jgi:hypothetical protein
MAFLPHDDCQRQRSRSTLRAAGWLAALRRTTSLGAPEMVEMAHVWLGEQEPACGALPQAQPALLTSDFGRGVL